MLEEDGIVMKRSLQDHSIELLFSKWGNKACLCKKIVELGKKECMTYTERSAAAKIWYACKTSLIEAKVYYARSSD